MSIYSQLNALKQMSSSELRQLWKKTFKKEPPRAYNVELLTTRLAAHIAAQQNDSFAILEQQRENDVLAFYEEDVYGQKTKRKQQYIIKPGIERRRRYKGIEYVVYETDQGLKFQGHVYKSYSAIATQITGQNCNGLKFFGL